MLLHFFLKTYIWKDLKDLEAWLPRPMGAQISNPGFSLVHQHFLLKYIRFLSQKTFIKYQDNFSKFFFKIHLKLTKGASSLDLLLCTGSNPADHLSHNAKKFRVESWTQKFFTSYWTQKNFIKISLQAVELPATAEAPGIPNMPLKSKPLDLEKISVHCIHCASVTGLTKDFTPFRTQKKFHQSHIRNFNLAERP